jgi:hypothetical protein
MSLIDKSKKAIKSRVNCAYILLNPSKTHIIYLNKEPTVDAPDMYAFNKLYVMLLNGKNSKHIDGFRGDRPNIPTYGIEWIENKYYDLSKQLNDQAMNDTSVETLEAIESEEAGSAMELWQKAYVEFLREFKIVSTYDVNYFSLRDLNGNATQELIIFESDDGGRDAVITVYSYDGTVYKVGDYSDPKIGVSNPRISDNPTYPGLFTLWWGGGVERYGYLTVKERKLIHEHLFDIDRTGETPRLIELSNDKQLIDESINAYPPYEYTDNLLEWCDE